MQLFHVDGLSDAEVRLEASKSDLHAGETVPLIGNSGRVWGAVSFPIAHPSTHISTVLTVSAETPCALAFDPIHYWSFDFLSWQAMRSHDGCKKPIFISSGHRISLETAIDVVKRCCRHRVPEPVRQVILQPKPDPMFWLLPVSTFGLSLGTWNYIVNSRTTISILGQSLIDAL